jgi:hypothetical protein
MAADLGKGFAEAQKAASALRAALEEAASAGTLRRAGASTG